MTLDELSPRKTEFYMTATTQSGEDQRITFVLRPFTLADELWLERNIGNEKEIQRVFAEMDLQKMLKIVFYQLTTQSKKKIMAIKVTDIDEQGNEIESEASGPERLGHLVRGLKDGMRIYMALMDCRGISQPVLTKMVEDDLKKKGLEIDMEILTGFLSTT